MKLPVEFTEYTKALFGEKRYNHFLQGVTSEPVVSIRTNPNKKASQLQGEPVAWADDVCYLDSRPSFTADPLFHAGCYYVQEASSMFLEQVFKQYISSPIRMLDLCAAPGGKALHMAELVGEKALVEARDISDLKVSFIEENTFIEPGSIIYHSRIGKGNKILANSRIINSVIGDDNKIISSDISDSFIGRGNNIGPFSHLRNYANIGNYNRIGNYVEIKDSIIGSYTNAAHLAYIGNTDCGSNVNFGCGSITVNYDGKYKHKTVIKDKAFIGCNSNLVAPVIIKENSFIAAGSTITNDVEEETLAIARARQVNKEGYMKKDE